MRMLRKIMAKYYFDVQLKENTSLLYQHKDIFCAKKIFIT